MRTKIIEEDVKSILSSLGSSLNRLEGKSILITGANGFLASYIVDTLVEFNKTASRPCKLVLINKNEINDKSRLSHLRGDPNVKFIAADVGKSFEVIDKVDIIIHAASSSTPLTNLDDPIGTIDANINGLRVLLEYAKKNKVEDFLFFSSAEIYGNPVKEFVPTSESYFGNVDPIGKRACYTESKRFGETLCINFFRKYGVPVKILRIFNTYGPGLRNNGKIVSEFFDGARTNKKILISSKGDGRRSWCYASDIALAIFFVWLNGKAGEAYNAGDDTNNISIIDLANLIKEVVNNGTEIVLNPDAKKQEMYGIDTRYPDITKLRKLGFQPKVSLKEGLKRMMENYDGK